MSDREFDNYLTLLASLLRLNPRQRSAIAEELRSHLEDRLEELTAMGVARDEAVRLALAEFGDAAHLAGQFGAISYERRRRWLMRLTTFSIAAMLLLAAGLAVFWPGRNAAPGLAEAAAQAPGNDDPLEPPPKAAGPTVPPPRGADPFAPGAAPTKLSGSAAAIEAALGKATSIEVVEMPLKDVVLFLQETNGVPIVLKLKKMEEAGVSPDTPVTRSLRGIRFSTALEVMLEDLGLTYYANELIFITSPQDAQAHMEIRVYDCRDLLRMEAPPGADQFLPVAASRMTGGMFAVDDQPPQPAGNAAGPRPNPADPFAPSPPGGSKMAPGGWTEQHGHAPEPVSMHDLRARRLMQIITTNVDPATWDYETGGGGSVTEYNGLLVVTQTAPTHRKIEHVLDMLREAAGLDVPQRGKVVR